jgi:hypothetical protein
VADEVAVRCLACGGKPEGCPWCTAGKMSNAQAARWHAEREGRPPKPAKNAVRKRTIVYRACMSVEESRALYRVLS